MTSVESFTKMIKLKSLFRRGQSQSSSSKGPPTGAIRGASSVSSLDSKHKIAPINPLKAGKAGSKDKLDKAGRNIQERNRHENKGNFFYIPAQILN